LYLTKPDYDESMLERVLWEDRERVNSEEAYRTAYQSNSGALVRFPSIEHVYPKMTLTKTPVLRPVRESK